MNRVVNKQTKLSGEGNVSKHLLVGAGEAVRVLDDALLANLDEELVAAQGAHVRLQLSFGDTLFRVVLEDIKIFL